MKTQAKNIVSEGQHNIAILGEPSTLVLKPKWNDRSHCCPGRVPAAQLPQRLKHADRAAEPTPQAKLLDACDELCDALDIPQQWRAELLVKATHIIEQFLADGPVQTTVAHMGTNAIREIAADLLDVAAESEIVRNERLRPTPWRLRSPVRRPRLSLPKDGTINKNQVVTALAGQ